MTDFVSCRMRDKGKQKAPPAKRAKPGSQRRDRPRQQMEKPMQPRNQVSDTLCAGGLVTSDQRRGRRVQTAQLDAPAMLLS